MSYQHILEGALEQRNKSYKASADDEYSRRVPNLSQAPYDASALRYSGRRWEPLSSPYIKGYAQQ